ncbi:diacylglycerol kinase [Hydromonas duriensis]|uniref:Diacylglycerol kinase n=1 Tax=Hydromonas duriensis TaxID=1527608 RepID=A0A4R6Y5A2_9BURK|nr:diacylglycerol kinase [Hydromonas duriensis]TDR30206.1 diacylglycerol kinase (ATP) [Hydromonas duriensis]
MFSPKRVINAFKYSIQGYKSAWHTEAAFRDNVSMVGLAQIFCFFIQPEWRLWLFFGACNVMLIMAELINTGLEYLADQISTEHHELLGRAKDVGSACVLTALLFNGLVLGTIIWQAL